MLGLYQAEIELAQYFSDTLGLNVNLRIAKSGAPESELYPGERAILEAFRTKSRQAIWLRGRQALKQLLADCSRSTDTSEILFPNWEFSLAHAGELAIAIQLGEDARQNDAIRGIGIDLEFNRVINPKTARFFLVESEANRSEHADLLRLWTMKEAMFKADPENSRRWLNCYESADPRLWQGCGEIVGESSLRIDYSSVSWRDGFISAAISQRCL